MTVLAVERWLVVATAVAVATTGCSGEGSSGSDEGGDHFSFVIEYSWEQAERLGAGPEQMALLEQARSEGEVSLEIYNEAIDNALRCIRESGYEPIDHGIHQDRGFPERGYTVPVEAEAADAVELAPGATVHRCIALHSFSVEGAYQNQPSSTEARQAHYRAAFEVYRDAIVECAEREGIEVDPGGDIIEIVEAVWAAVDSGMTDVDCAEGIP